MVLNAWKLNAELSARNARDPLTIAAQHAKEKPGFRRAFRYCGWSVDQKLARTDRPQESTLSPLSCTLSYEPVMPQVSLMW